MASGVSGKMWPPSFSHAASAGPFTLRRLFAAAVVSTSWALAARHSFTAEIVRADRTHAATSWARAVDTVRITRFTSSSSPGATLKERTPRPINSSVYAGFPAISPQTETSLRSEEHTSELQSQSNLVCRLLLEKKNTTRLGHQH